MCNFPDNPQRKLCWPVRLNIQNGAASTGWPSRIAGKHAAAEVTVAADANIAMALSGWNVNDGNPLAGALNGRVADDRIDLKGRWANGAPIEGHWTRAP
jgi:hypothetical protein